MLPRAVGLLIEAAPEVSKLAGYFLDCIECFSTELAMKIRYLKFTKYNAEWIASTHTDIIETSFVETKSGLADVLEIYDKVYHT